MQGFLSSRRVVPAALLLCLGSAVQAHEIPTRVSATVYAARIGDRVRVLVRVPMAAMRDVRFPERADGTLDLSRVAPFAREAAQLWVADAVRLIADGRALTAPLIDAVHVERPSSTAFRSWTAADASFRTVVDTAVHDLPTEQSVLDVAMSVSLPADASQLAIDARFARLGERTTTLLHLVHPDREPRVLLFEGDAGALPFDPTWWDASSRFVRLGFTHILDGIDHLLFLLCLVLPLRRVSTLVTTVTAFTLAHSITLVGAALGLAPDAPWFAPLVEVLIAASIIIMAIENLFGAVTDRRWMLAFGFGLVHGFGFAAALRDALQFAGSHLAASLAAFNVGVELGQLAVLAVVLPAILLAVRSGVPERVGILVVSAIIAHSAWHWMADRWTALRAFPWAWPAFDVALAAMAAQLALLVAIAVGVAWGYRELLKRWSDSGPSGPRVVSRVQGVGTTSA
jgi:hypothetical protein